MRLHIQLMVVILTAIVAQAFVVWTGNKIERLDREAAQLLAESETAWLESKEDAREKKCRKVIANYAHGVGGAIYSVGTAERLYQLCLNKNLSR